MISLSKAALSVAVALSIWAMLAQFGGAQSDGQSKITLASDRVHAEMEGMPIEVCLACHGPIEVLRETTRDWVAPSGIPVNPHISFDVTNHLNPHASGEGITQCTQCHVPHAIPLEAPMPTATIDSCIQCHHTATFRRCSECH